MDRAVSSVRDGWLDMHSRGDGLALLGVQRSMVGKARVSTMALVLAAAILLGAGSCESLSSLSFRPAFLESVVSNRRVIAQDADGFYAALPTDEPIRLRMQADFGFVQAVAVNDTVVPKRESGRTPEGAWWRAEVIPPGSAARHWFWDLTLQLPPELQGNLRRHTREPSDHSDIHC